MEEEDEEALLTQGGADLDGDLEEEIKDWQQLPRRGEKEYEPDGTTLQQSVLNRSLQAMFQALRGERGHALRAHAEAHWDLSSPDQHSARVPNPKGSFLQTTGTVDHTNTGWLSPEEAVYLAERGTVEPRVTTDGITCTTISIQEAYAFAFETGQQIDEYSVYAYLKRLGFIVARPERWKHTGGAGVGIGSTSTGFRYPWWNIAWWRTAWLWFRSSVKNAFTSLRNLCDSFMRHTSYSRIFASIKLIPFTTSNYTPPTNYSSKFKITFNVWKPNPKFRKTDPPTPDFQVVVINTNENKFPTLSNLYSLFNDSETTIPHTDNQLNRLKYGVGKTIIIAVVDNGVINFINISQALFGQENVWFDQLNNNNNRKKQRRKGAKN